MSPYEVRRRLLRSLGRPSLVGEELPPVAGDAYPPLPVLLFELTCPVRGTTPVLVRRRELWALLKDLPGPDPEEKDPVDTGGDSISDGRDDCDGCGAVHSSRAACCEATKSEVRGIWLGGTCVSSGGPIIPPPVCKLSPLLYSMGWFLVESIVCVDVCPCRTLLVLGLL